MGVGVVARYSTLVEAEIACGALRGAGFHADVFEAGVASLYWDRLTAFGGVRVTVPLSELQDAVDYLLALTRTWRRPRPYRRDKGWLWRLFAFVIGLTLGPAAGWLVIGARYRAAKHSALSLWAVLLIALAMTLPLMLASAALYGFPDTSGAVTFSPYTP